MTPRGRFGLGLDPAAGGTYHLIGAGSGIAALAPIARVLAAGPMNRIHLLVGNRTPEDMIFGRMLEQLSAENQQVTLTHVFSRAPHAPGLHGHVDDHRPAHLQLHPATPADQFFICGPDAMIDDTVAELQRLGIDGSHIHREYFAASAPLRQAEPVTIKALLDGEDLVTQTDRNTVVTEALERAGAEPPVTCRTGACSSCVARIDSGSAVMRNNQSLTPQDVADGLVLTCQAVATSSELVLTYE